MKSWLVPCLYREGEQRAHVRALLEDVLQENMAGVTQGDVESEDLPPGGNLITYFESLRSYSEAQDVLGRTGVENSDPTANVSQRTV